MYLQGWLPPPSLLVPPITCFFFVCHFFFFFSSSVVKNVETFSAVFQLAIFLFSSILLSFSSLLLSVSICFTTFLYPPPLSPSSPPPSQSSLTPIAIPVWSWMQGLGCDWFLRVECSGVCLFLFYRNIWPNTLYVLSLGKHAVSVSDWLLATWECEQLFFNPTGWLSSYTCSFLCMFISCSSTT